MFVPGKLIFAKSNIKLQYFAYGVNKILVNDSQKLIFQMEHYAYIEENRWGHSWVNWLKLQPLGPNHTPCAEMFSSALDNMRTNILNGKPNKRTHASASKLVTRVYMLFFAITGLTVASVILLQHYIHITLPFPWLLCGIMLWKQLDTRLSRVLLITWFKDLGISCIREGQCDFQKPATKACLTFGIMRLVKLWKISPYIIYTAIPQLYIEE